MRLLDVQQLVRLRDELRRSMRQLLTDLCRELHVEHVGLAREYSVPTGLFERLRSRFTLEAYSNWKVVGWIETLNDLVYFFDVLKQWKLERDPVEFARQLFEECQEKFFEHGYFDELFPNGKPQARGLDRRLSEMCRRLTQELTQECLWFIPAVTVQWVRQRKMTSWDVPGVLNHNAERSEVATTISVDDTGAWCSAPDALRRALRRSSKRVVFKAEPTRISVKIGKAFSLVWSGSDERGQWQWAYHEPTVARHGDTSSVTVGPTLVYGANRQPRTVKHTDQRQVDRIARAWDTIHLAWPEGHELLELFTSRLIPLRARDVVSFSYRHRPGLSFINCFDRDNLDLIDDLIHENSHHHLNLLLRKHVMYRGDHNQQIFYSPWRRSLRPLRGILHATFTFTMGALLFERLSSWASDRGGMERWKKAGLGQRDLHRARFRCMEEIASVRYSLQDLHYADHHLGWLTGSGRRLVGQLVEAIDQVESKNRRFRRHAERSPFGSALRKHIEDLHQARRKYGPMRLGRV